MIWLSKRRDRTAPKVLCEVQKKHPEILVDYCAKTLEPSRVAELERHIETCGDCRDWVGSQDGLWRALEGWTPAPVSPDFDVRLYARIAQEEEAPLWRRWRRRISYLAPLSMWKPALSLGVASAILMVGFLVRMPNLNSASSQVHPQKIDIEQVEKTLEDLDMLMPVSQSPAS